MTDTGVMCRGCAGTGYDLTGKPCVCGLVDQISEHWLRANGWQIAGRPENTPGLRRREVGNEVLGGRPFMGSSDDLCIDVAPGHDGAWFVWIHQCEPHRHIHVRHMRFVWELTRLWEGLTGKTWSEE